MRYFAGVYTIGSVLEQVSCSPVQQPSPHKWIREVTPRRWTRCWTTRLAQGEQRAFIFLTGNDIIRVDSIHAFGFALIGGATVGEYLAWPPGTEPNARPTLFVEPARVAQQGQEIRILLVGDEFQPPEERTEPQCQKPTETPQT